MLCHNFSPFESLSFAEHKSSVILVTNILQNIFYVQQTKETHTGLVQLLIFFYQQLTEDSILGEQFNIKQCTFKITLTLTSQSRTTETLSNIWNCHLIHPLICLVSGLNYIVMGQTGEQGQGVVSPHNFVMAFKTKKQRDLGVLKNIRC